MVVSNTLEPFGEVLALRLKRLSVLAEADANSVRDQQAGGLYYLRPDSMGGLDLENAAIVTSLLKLPVGALDTTSELGCISESELRDIHERIADLHSLRLDRPVLEKALELMAKLAEVEPGA